MQHDLRICIFTREKQDLKQGGSGQVGESRKNGVEDIEQRTTRMGLRAAIECHRYDWAAEEGEADPVSVEKVFRDDARDVSWTDDV